MTREVNMRSNNATNDKSKRKTNNNKSESKIITDPFGSWTGVCEDDKTEQPVQDADDL